VSPEEAVRKFFDCYTNGRPEDFDECVAPGYADPPRADRQPARLTRPEASAWTVTVL
jgi:hypothetical protein